MSNRLAATALSLAFALAAGQAWAGGTITNINPSKLIFDLGESLTVDVAGNIALDQFKRGCGVSVVMQYADNSTEVAHAGMAANLFPMTGIYVKPSKVGYVRIIAAGAPANLPGGAYPACQGSRTAIVEVKAPPKQTLSQLSAEIHPSIAQVAPVEISVLPTLTGLKQVPNTDQGGETWLEVSGTGACNFTVQGANLPAAAFASSAATPFPMKVKIPGAPIGSYNWTAKGEGACHGSASGNATVQQ